MKTTFAFSQCVLVFALCFTTATAYSQDTPSVYPTPAVPAGPTTQITFEETAADFGIIEEGELVTHVFTFTNTGNEPLILSNARGSCGCTVPNYPKDTPIAPGDSAEVTVKFDSNNKPNANNRSVTFTTNTAKGREVIQIRTFVTPDPLKEQQREARRQAMQANQ